MDWGNEERGSSGQFNSDESVFIDNPQDGLWFVAVHGLMLEMEMVRSN